MFNLSKITSKYRANLIFKAYKTLLHKADMILDLGCGNGVIASYLGENLKNKITGCDIKNHLIKPMPFILIKEKKKLPLEDKSYDVVMINDVLHHTQESEQYKLLNEALRIGKKVLVFEDRPTMMGKLFDFMLNKLHYSDLKTPLTFKNETEWLKIFKKLKAKCKIIQVSSPSLYPFSHIAFVLTR